MLCEIRDRRTNILWLDLYEVHNTGKFIKTKSRREIMRSRGGRF